MPLRDFYLIGYKDMSLIDYRYVVKDNDENYGKIQMEP